MYCYFTLVSGEGVHNYVETRSFDIIFLLLFLVAAGEAPNDYLLRGKDQTERIKLPRVIAW